MSRKWWTLEVACAANFMLRLDVTIVIVALPEIQHGVHGTFTDVQWAMDAYALTLASLQLTSGSGPRRTDRNKCGFQMKGRDLCESCRCRNSEDPRSWN